LAVENPIRQLFVVSGSELKFPVKAVAGGAVVMMSPEDCKRRSVECLAAAKLCSEGQGQQAWKQLSDLWVAWSDTLGIMGEHERLSSMRGLRPPYSY
jgi:hypothetical protein